MREPMELEDITGLTMTVVGVLIESYVQEGYADPTMYKALRATEELAEHFRARLEYEGKADTEIMAGVVDLITSLKLTAIECGEVVEQIIEKNGWQEQGKNWSDPNHDCADHEHESEDE